MQRVLAICSLTWKAAFRFKLFWILLGLLLLCVVALPLLLKDDGTARGFTQIIITYTLGTIAALLGLSTLWLACGTLARDIEECQIQMVAVKPVSRWQIWLGKWLGLVTLNAALLAISGTSVFLLLQYRATRLPADQQEVLREEVLIARETARLEDVSAEISDETERRFQERLRMNPVAGADAREVRREIREQVKAEYQVVPSGYMRQWRVRIPDHEKLGDRPLQLRVKFNSSDGSVSGTFGGAWQIGLPGTTPVWQSEPMSLAPETHHEFPVPGLFESDGTLTVTFVNPNKVALLFPLEDGFEVLYPVGGFAGNFLRGMVVIFCWMILFATLGLTASTFLSFPVAAFVSLSALMITLSSGTMANAVAEGTIADWNAEKGTKGSSHLDTVVIPAFKATLAVINLAKNFSPIDNLSTGRSITWGQLGLAVSQIVLLLCGVLAAIGISVFHRRELATAQGTQ